MKIRNTFPVEVGKRWYHAIKQRIERHRRETGRSLTIQAVVDEALELYLEDGSDHGPDPRQQIIVWACDHEGNCTYISPLWHRLTGQTREQALGHGFEQAVHPDDRAKIAALFERAFRERRFFFCEFRLLLARGGWLRMRTHAGPVYGGPGHKFLGFVGSSFEIQSGGTALRLDEVEILGEAISVEHKESHWRQFLN